MNGLCCLTHCFDFAKRCLIVNVDDYPAELMVITSNVPKVCNFPHLLLLMEAMYFKFAKDIDIIQNITDEF